MLAASDGINFFVDYLYICLEHVFVTSESSQTELMDIQSETWQIRSSYPYGDDAKCNLPFYYRSTFIVFGGLDRGAGSTIIAQYIPASNSWKKLGNMTGPRSHHTGVRSLDSFYIYGGRQTSTVEVCILSGDSIQCEEQQPPYG